MEPANRAVMSATSADPTAAQAVGREIVRIGR
jgi:hypothetical protein